MRKNFTNEIMGEAIKILKANPDAWDNPSFVRLVRKIQEVFDEETDYILQQMSQECDDNF